MKDIRNTILFGKYLILSCLGTGNFSTVYLSKHQILETYRVVKCIPKLEDTTVSLLSEAKLLKSLNHPGIPKIYDIYEDNAYFYLIEEYIEGESLNEFLLHQSHISQYTFIEWSLQLCNIFQYLHTFESSPILYLDLKPEHIIVCGTDIKLIDYNVADYVSNLGNICNLYGNEDFSAPELSSGTVPNFLADIYSIGKIMQYLSLHLDKSISPKFQKIIHKATDTDTSGRFETVDQLISAITQEKILIGQPHTRIKIAIVGSHPGCGATHFAISFVSTLNYMGYSTIYYEKNAHAHLRFMQSVISHMKESNGMLHYRFFKGYPNYGLGIRLQDSNENISVYSYEEVSKIDITDFDFILYICSNAPWHHAKILKQKEAFLPFGDKLKLICNMGQRDTMHRLSKHYQLPVHHYWYDIDPFIVTKQKVSFVSHLLSLKRRRRLFFHFDPKEILFRQK